MFKKRKKRERPISNPNQVYSNQHYGLKKNCPYITRITWELYRKEGWRWHHNIDHRVLLANTQHIERMHREYDQGNVTIGYAFDRGKGPRYHYDTMGIYVKDIDNQVDQLMNEIKEMEVWINESNSEQDKFE